MRAFDGVGVHLHGPFRGCLAVARTTPHISHIGTERRVLQSVGGCAAEGQAKA